MTKISQKPRLAVILAGGQSRRMGAIDKAEARMGEERLIDLVIARLTPLASEIILSSPTDYGTGLQFIPDDTKRFAGPAAGLWAIMAWLKLNQPQTQGFYTVPVDAPCFPLDLLDQLESVGGGAVAHTSQSIQPVFAYWDIAQLYSVMSQLPNNDQPSMKALAKMVGAKPVMFDDERAFANINTPEDLATISKQLSKPES